MLAPHGLMPRGGFDFAASDAAPAGPDGQRDQEPLELDDTQETGRVVECRLQLKALMREYGISDETVVEWIDQGILKDERD